MSRPSLKDNEFLGSSTIRKIEAQLTGSNIMPRNCEDYSLMCGICGASNVKPCEHLLNMAEMDAGDLTDVMKRKP